MKMFNLILITFIDLMPGYPEVHYWPAKKIHSKRIVVHFSLSIN